MRLQNIFLCALQGIRLGLATLDFGVLMSDLKLQGL